MPMKKHKPEQIVSLLRQIEVEMANGKTTPQACKEAEITVQTFYRWRKEFGGLKLEAQIVIEKWRVDYNAKRPQAVSRRRVRCACTDWSSKVENYQALGAVCSRRLLCRC